MLFFPTVDEDVAYFRSQGYTGSLNDMHYKAMGDLGYTGSLNDRTHAYLTFKYGSYYAAMRDLRNGTSVFALSPYIINGFDPALVFDFKGDYYKTGGATTTFSSAITHAATTNATMVDSDGLLKWRPHNLLTHSGDLTNAGWKNNRLTVTTGQNDFEGNPTAFKIAPTAVSGTHSIYKISSVSNVVNGILTTVTIDLKADGYNFVSVALAGNRYAIINLSNGAVSLNTGSVSPTVTSLGNGWYRCSITASAILQEVFSVVETSQAVNYGATTFTGNGTSGVLVAYPHSFRSDLGGMVNNLDTNSSYVPTTSAVVYAPRRGHHIYNGSAWVNEGILHESEARTNLLLNSGTLSTQSATVANVANTLSFTGTGTVTLSGVSTAGPLVGTGTGENNRVSLTFTPTAGTLTLTVSGTVTNAQLEAGSTPSSYIPTAGASATRAAETLTVPAANLPYDSTNMSIQIDGKMTYADNGLAGEVEYYRWQLGSIDYIFSYLSTQTGRSGQPIFAQRQAASGYDDVKGGNLGYSPDTNVPFNRASRHGSTFINGAHEGTLLTANTTPTVLPDLSATDLQLGYTFMGTIGQFRMWDEDITDAGITEAST